MKLLPVNDIPEKSWNRPTKSNLRGIVDSFAISKYVVVQVVPAPYEYASTESLSEALRIAVSRTPYSNIKIYKRGDHVYMKKE